MLLAEQGRNYFVLLNESCLYYFWLIIDAMRMLWARGIAGLVYQRMVGESVKGTLIAWHELRLTALPNSIEYYLIKVSFHNFCPIF